jgi:glycosyltransferase involved in cell wall biosynthesis
VSDAEKSAVLAACDILCVPSLEESLGGVYLEAWYYKKPIIAADIPPLRELTDNGKGGFLVDLEPTAIAAKVLCLLEDDQLRDQMGAWGQRKVLTAYDWDNLARKTESIYTKLVNGLGPDEAR